MANKVSRASRVGAALSKDGGQGSMKILLGEQIRIDICGRKLTLLWVSQQCSSSLGAGFLGFHVTTGVHLLPAARRCRRRSIGVRMESRIEPSRRRRCEGRSYSTHGEAHGREGLRPRTGLCIGLSHDHKTHRSS